MCHEKFRQSFEEESRKRGENAYAQDLISWHDGERNAAIQEVNQIKYAQTLP